MPAGASGAGAAAVSGAAVSAAAVSGGLLSAVRMAAESSSASGVAWSDKVFSLRWTGKSGSGGAGIVRGRARRRAILAPWSSDDEGSTTTADRGPGTPSGGGTNRHHQELGVIEIGVPAGIVPRGDRPEIAHDETGPAGEQPELPRGETGGPELGPELHALRGAHRGVFVVDAAPGVEGVGLLEIADLEVS